MHSKRIIPILLISFMMVSILSPMFPSNRSYAEDLPYKVVQPIPILFVHGYNDNGDSWEQSEFYNYVQTLGARVYSLDYGNYNRNDITSKKFDEIYTKGIKKLLKGLPSDTKFDIVAHSMGGLLTRYYLQQHPDVRKKVRRVITIGTPHHGSPVAMFNRLADMLDDPEDYWQDGSKNQEVQKYKELYDKYCEYIYDHFHENQGQVIPFEQWLVMEESEIIERLRDHQFQGAGIDLNIGTPELEGGVKYRYSRAFEDYAKLLVGRHLARKERERLLTDYAIASSYLSEDVVKNTFIAHNDTGEDRQYVDGEKWVDEVTGVKEAWDTFKNCTPESNLLFLGAGPVWLPLKDCNPNQKSSAKNIVQDRLMNQHFEFGTGIRDDGKLMKEYIVANLFLHNLEKSERKSIEKAKRKKEYYPQFITLGTVDDPNPYNDRWWVDLFVKKLEGWTYEPHDSVVPITSTILHQRGFLDWYHIQDENSGYFAHRKQMEATDLLRMAYDHPLTGTNDEDIILELDPTNPSSLTGTKVILKPNRDTFGQEMIVKMNSVSHTKVNVIKRNWSQTWDKYETIMLKRNFETNGQDFYAEFRIKPDDEVSDYLIVSPNEITVTYEPVDEEGKKVQADYPYLIQVIDSHFDEESGEITHTFKVIRRMDDQSMSNLRNNDFVFQVDHQNIQNLRFKVEHTKEKNGGNILMTLDYSDSMEGIPLTLSKKAAEKYIEGLKKHSNIQVGVLGFSDQVKVLSVFTTSYDQARLTVYDKLQGGTALYDAIIAGSQMLSSQEGNRTLILLTDGSDTSSSHSEEEAIQIAKEHNVTIYIVCLGGDVNMEVLQRITTATGGKLFTTYNPNDLDQIYSNITDIDDYTYSVTYKVDDFKKAHQFSVRLTGQRSNTSTMDYGPFFPAQDRNTPWDKSKKLIHDLKEAY
jgi:pimeloyl-ACP methyl ester carboxylesterase/Mg-chelatase subunit ChlD